METVTIVALVFLIIILLYVYFEFVNDPIKWRRTKFELKMLWMGTKGNYEDAIMRKFNFVCKCVFTF
jgi:lipoprotein signal peptidase